MAQQTSPSSVNDPTPLPDEALIDALFELAAGRDVETLLNRALGIIIRMLKAEAGSILFQSQIPYTLRLGAFRPDALKRIERWEEIISQRLAAATWNIAPTASLPISVSKFAESQMMLLNIPLLRDTTVVGSLSLVLSQAGTINDRQRRLLEQVAKAVGQIGSLVSELASAQQRLDQIGVFHQASQALVTTFDIHRLLADTMQLAANVIDAGASSLMLIDEATQELVFEISQGSHGKTLREQRIPLDEGIAGWVAQHGHPVIANNARTDPRFSHRVDVRTGFLTQSIAAVPLKIKGRIIGVLEVLNKYASGGFGHEDIQLINAIAAQAAIAIENSRLYQRTAQQRDEAISGLEQRCRQLSDQLHHGPVRLLSAIQTSLDHLERLNQIEPEAVHHEIGALRNLVHKATHSLHTLPFDLPAVTLESQGFVTALEHYVDHLHRAVPFTVHFDGADEVSLDSQTAAVMFAIIQEAVNNVRYHAEARNLWLSLAVEEAQLLITVRDDGQGFDVAETMNPSAPYQALGLRMIQERAETIKGTVSVISNRAAPKRGTTVQLKVSLAEYGSEGAEE